jgi:hypothetical protein
MAASWIGFFFKHFTVPCGEQLGGLPMGPKRIDRDKSGCLTEKDVISVST